MNSTQQNLMNELKKFVAELAAQDEAQPGAKVARKVTAYATLSEIVTNYTPAGEGVWQSKDGAQVKFYASRHDLFENPVNLPLVPLKSIEAGKNSNYTMIFAREIEETAKLNECMIPFAVVPKA